MEASPLFELACLKRDWIGGTTGSAFFECVQQHIRLIEAEGQAVRVRGVMLCESDPVRFAAAFFAGVQLGVPVLLANPKWQRVEWEQVDALVNPAVIVGDAPLATTEREGVEHPQAGTILIPTGGSSAGVKFAIHTWQSLAAACEGLSTWMGAGPIHAYCVLPLYHVSGLMQLLRACVTQGAILFPEFKELQAGNLPGVAANRWCLSLVPTQLQRLMAQADIVEWLRALRAIFIGGASTPSAVLERARALKLPLVLSYGMTETAAMVAALPVEEFLAGETTAGRPLSHAQIQVLRADGSECAVNEVGRVQIQARSLFRGYHGRAVAPKANGYWTEDEGFFNAQGHLTIVGRSDRLIISGGEKIDPHEVEQALLQTGAVEQALVVAWPDAEWGQRLVAFYVPSSIEENAEGWESALRADLVNYKIPKQMIQVPRLPLNERGKVDRLCVARLIGEEDGHVSLS